MIADWVRLYPKGKSVDFPRITAEDNARWSSMVQSHSQSSIRAKVYYYRMNVLKDVAPKPSMGRMYVPRKIYKCRKCDFKTDTKQSLGVHYRFQHPVDKNVIRTMPLQIPQGQRDINGEFIMANVPTALVNQFVIVSPDGTVRPAKLLKHCPECMEPLIALNVARNI